MSSSGALRVLVADADPSIRSLLMAVAQHMGLGAVPARDANAAVALAAQQEFAAAVIDLSVNNPELVTRLVEVCPPLRGNVIVLTTLPPGVLENSAEAFCVLRKPFQLQDLQQSLRHCCAARGR